LGKSAHIRDLEIWWPASDTRQHFTDVATNQFLEIREFSKSYNKLERHSFQLDGSRSGVVSPKVEHDAKPAK
jgi:hypothetical protein